MNEVTTAPKSKSNSKFQGHLAVIVANTIFGLSVPVTNDLVVNHLTPMGYMFFRCAGAALLFWLIALFLPRERVARKDLWVMIGGGLLGFAVSQTLAAWSLHYTTPVYFSILAALTPIAVMILAWFFLRERITGWRLVGVLLGIGGVVLMTLMGAEMGTGSNDLLGILLGLGSLLTWAVYLIITSKVSEKYSSVTQMKWMFLASTVAVLPLAWNELPAQALWSEPDMARGIVEMVFIIVIVTVLAFFLIPFAMKRIEATMVSVYTNLQPIVASAVSIIIGVDLLTWDKVAAAVLVLLSAYIVSRPAPTAAD